MNSLRLLAFTAAVITCALSRLSAEPVTIVASWSGSPINNASAGAIITFDSDAFLLPNPGSADLRPQPVAVTLTVANSLNTTTNNTTFHLNNFQAILVTFSAPVNLTSNWVGQAGLSQFAFIGNSNNSNAPASTDGTNLAVLFSAAGQFFTEDMTLTSVQVIPTSVTLGYPVSNLPGGQPGVILSSLHTPCMSPSGVEFFYGTIKSTAKPSNLPSGTTNCLLGWDHSSGVLSSILQSGVTSYYTQYNDNFGFKSFGSPVSANGQLYFQCGLPTNLGYFIYDGNSAIEVTKTSSLMLMSNAPGSNVVNLYARQGEMVSSPAGFHITKFDWFHPVSNGLFFGAQTADDTTPKPLKSHGAYFSDGSTVTPLAVAGQSIAINGSGENIVKSVSKPTVTAPAQAETRVGNDHSIALIITTLNGPTAIKTFSAPQAPQ